jgi:hypothetical protein
MRSLFEQRIERSVSKVFDALDGHYTLVSLKLIESKDGPLQDAGAERLIETRQERHRPRSVLGRFRSRIEHVSVKNVHPDEAALGATLDGHRDLSSAEY